MTTLCKLCLFALQIKHFYGLTPDVPAAFRMISLISLLQIQVFLLLYLCYFSIRKENCLVMDELSLSIVCYYSFLLNGLKFIC